MRFCVNLKNIKRNFYPQQKASVNHKQSRRTKINPISFLSVKFSNFFNNNLYVDVIGLGKPQRFC